MQFLIPFINTIDWLNFFWRKSIQHNLKQTDYMLTKRLVLGLYNGAADHFTHEIGLGPIVGLDWHFANSSGSWVVRDEDQYYSTTAFADRVVDIVENHDESQVTCSATNS